MHFHKKILAAVVAAAMSVTVLGTGAAIGVSADSTNSFALSSSTVKILGRSFRENGYTCFSYGNAGIDVNFSGTDFYIDVAQLDGLNPSTDIMVLVDTEMPMEATCYTVTSSTGWLRVASNLSNGNHFVKIMKKCRGIGAGGSFGTDYFGIRSIAVNEGGSILTPDAKSDLIIEAYGDSITNGDATWLNPDGSNSSYSWAAYSGVVAVFSMQMFIRQAIQETALTHGASAPETSSLRAFAGNSLSLQPASARLRITARQTLL